MFPETHPNDIEHAFSPRDAVFEVVRTSMTFPVLPAYAVNLSNEVTVSLDAPLNLDASNLNEVLLPWNLRTT